VCNGKVSKIVSTKIFIKKSQNLFVRFFFFISAPGKSYNWGEDLACGLGEFFRGGRSSLGETFRGEDLA